MPSPIENMEAAIQTFKERNLVYGDNWKRFGPVMAALFPKGILITTEEEWNRFGCFLQVMSKITRYANNIAIGHIDSIHDAGVYSFMLESLDQEAEEKRSDAVWIPTDL